jgi:ribosome-associated toxin RatA of RatAB toxin-antitoxin module
MAERTEGSKTMNASAADIMAAIMDFDSYPDWAGVKSATVTKKDEKGRPSEVAMEVDVPMMGTARYTLQYQYKANDGGVSWTTKQVDEGPIKDIKGEYRLEELDEDETDVAYEVSLELGMKIPGMLRRRGEKEIVKRALDGLKKRVEQG